MIENDESGPRIQALYWKQLVQLKVECEYVRLYQNGTGWWVQTVAVCRAAASVGAIGAWAVVKEHALVWGGVIAGAQVADAMQGAIPFNRNHQAASALVITLDALFIASLGEWEDIYAGRIDEIAIKKARLRLMQQMHDAQAKHFPTGIRSKDARFRLAEKKANDYFKATFGTGAV